MKGTVVKIRNKIATSIYSMSEKVLSMKSFFMKNKSSAKAFQIGAVGMTTFLTVGKANAASNSDGFASLAAKGAEQSSSIQESAATFFYVIGFVLVGIGIYNLYRKGKEEHSTVTGKQIFIPMLAGAGLSAVAFILDKTAETVAIDTENYGTVK